MSTCGYIPCNKSTSEDTYNRYLWGVISAKTLTSFMQYHNHLGQHFAGVNLCVQRRLADLHGEVVYTNVECDFAW